MASRDVEESLQRNRGRARETKDVNPNSAYFEGDDPDNYLALGALKEKDLLLDYLTYALQGVDPQQKVMRAFAWLKIGNLRIHTDLSAEELRSTGEQVWGQEPGVTDKFGYLKSFRYGMKGSPTLNVEFYDDNADNIEAWSNIFKLSDEIVTPEGNIKRIAQADTSRADLFGQFQFGWWNEGDRSTYRSKVHSLAFKSISFDYRGGGLYISAEFVPLAASMMTQKNRINYKKMLAGDVLSQFHQDVFGNRPIFIPSGLQQDLNAYTTERDWESYTSDPVETLEFWMGQALTRNANPVYMVWADTVSQEREIVEIYEQEKKSRESLRGDDDQDQNDLSLAARDLNNDLVTNRDGTIANERKGSKANGKASPALQELAPEKFSDGRMVFIEMETTKVAVGNRANWLFGNNSRKLIYGGTSPFASIIVQDMSIKIDKNNSMILATINAYDTVERGDKQDDGRGNTPNSTSEREQQISRQLEVGYGALANLNGGAMNKLEDGAAPEDIARAMKISLNRKVRTFENIHTVMELDLELLGIPYLDEIQKVMGKYFELKVIKPYRIVTKSVNGSGYTLEWIAGQGAENDEAEPAISGYYITTGVEHSIDSDGKYTTTINAKRMPLSLTNGFNNLDEADYKVPAYTAAQFVD